MNASSPHVSRPSGLAAALNAISNASRTAASEADIRVMLETGRGDPSHVRALFGDVSLDTLLRLAIHFGLEMPTVRAAYAVARAETAAANAEFDALPR